MHANHRQWYAITRYMHGCVTNICSVFTPLSARQQLYSRVTVDNEHRDHYGAIGSREIKTHHWLMLAYIIGAPCDIITSRPTLCCMRL